MPHSMGAYIAHVGLITAFRVSHSNLIGKMANSPAVLLWWVKRNNRTLSAGFDYLANLRDNLLNLKANEA